MVKIWGTFWLLFAVFAASFSEPTPQPSVEPSTTTPSAVTTSSTSKSSDLAEEGQDQVAILKQINRVNEDGSYTFGYEAADGSFKIETRDVAGNVKGMFGFVDEGGELKRVSYSASNGTGFQTTGSPDVPSIVTPDDFDSATRNPLFSNREPTTRISLLPGTTSERPPLPVYIYQTTTRTPQPEVIQHIPKLRPTPASLSTAPTESAEIVNPRRPTYAGFLPRKSAMPHYISLKSTTLATDVTDESTGRPSVIQVIRPKGYKKVLVTKRPIEEVSTTPFPVTSTEFYPVSYTDGTVQRQIDSNSVSEGGLAASGTEDSPDVFGGGPTARPYPAAAYRTLFNPLPQYQRILQTSFLQNQNQFLAAGADRRAANGPGYAPYGNQGPVPNRFQDPAAIAQFAQVSQRGQNLPYPVDPRDPRQGLSQAGPNVYPVDPRDPGRQNLPPTGPNFYPGDQSRQGLPPAGRNLQYPVDAARQGAAIPGRQDIPQEQLGRPYPGQYPGSENIAPYPQDQVQNINPRPPQTLPPSGYNPSQGLANVDDPLRRQPQIPPPYNPQYNQEQPNPQNFLMEQLIRMLLAAQIQSRPQQQLSPFQQALISTLGANNIPQDLLPNRNYDPRYSYPNYQQRQPYYPPYDPRYNYQNYQDPYSAPAPAPGPYQSRYNPYYAQNSYQGYNPYQGYSPNPLYQYPPEESLLRMFLGQQRYPGPIPQPSPQIQTSPAAFDRSPPYPPQQPGNVEPPLNPGQVFGQRIPIVERSPYPQREASTERSTVYARRTPPPRGKGSRNVQILDESAASESTTTTSKPL